MSPYRLSVCVMSHPSRAERAANLARAIQDSDPGEGGTAVEIVVDPEPTGPPTAFRTTMTAWSSAPTWATHRLVVHDDMLPAVGFLAEARQAVAQFPTAALALFSFWNSRNGAAARLGGLVGYRWIHAMQEYMPCTALILPVDVAHSFVTFARSAGDAWAEDVLMYRYLRSANVPSYVSTLSLAQHEAMLTSVSGNDFQGLRRASWFVPDPARLTSPPAGLAPPFSAVPFFKRGIDRCALRIMGTAGSRWEEITGRAFLARHGRAAAWSHALEKQSASSVVSSMGGVAVEPLRSAWRTAYAMGVVCADDPRLQSRVSDRGGGTKDVLETLYPGGMCDRLGDADLPAMSLLAERAFEAGFTARASVAGSKTRSREVDDSVSLAGRGGFPATRLMQSLVDLGHNIVASDRTLERRAGGAGAQPVAVVEVDAPPAQIPKARAAGAMRVRVRHPVSAGHQETCEIRVDDVYGPGMPASSPLAGMVLRALMNQPIELASPASEPLSLVHVDDLAYEVSGVLSGDCGSCHRSIVAERPLTVGALVQSIRRVVRPIPIRFSGSSQKDDVSPVDVAASSQPILDERIHELAQWLAYQADSPLSVTALESMSDGFE